MARLALAGVTLLALGLTACGSQQVGSPQGSTQESTQTHSTQTDAATSGRWKLRTNREPCADLGGRVGSDRQLVPGEPTGMVVCTNSVPRAASPELRRTLQQALNRLPTAVSQGWASCTSTGDSTQHVFTYPVGPQIGVSLEPHCTPQVMGAGRQARSAGQVTQILKDAGYL